HFRDAGIRVVVQGEVDVQFLLKQSSMLITDYSSVAFDFAFLHKPVAYYQFDDHRFARPHADPSAEFPGPVVFEEKRCSTLSKEPTSQQVRWKSNIANVPMFSWNTVTQTVVIEYSERLKTPLHRKPHPQTWCKAKLPSPYTGLSGEAGTIYLS